MKKYNVIFTHNPQDFFEGSEPDELREAMTITEEAPLELILRMVDRGYVAVVFQRDGDDG